MWWSPTSDPDPYCHLSISQNHYAVIIINTLSERLTINLAGKLWNKREGVGLDLFGEMCIVPAKALILLF